MDAGIQKKLLTFFSKYTVKQYKKGEVLIRQLENPEGLFLLTKGIVRMYSVSEDGEELELNVFKPYSFFPVGWLINSTQNRYYFDAITDAEVYIAPKPQALAFLHQEHEIVFDLLSRMYKGLDGYFMRVGTLLTGAAYYKTIAEIMISARRFGESGRGNTFHVKLTHHQIASRTGLSRETVTREIRKLQKKGIVSYEGEQLTIIDISTLEEELSSS